MSYLYNIVNVLNPTELYTLSGENGKLSDVIFITIKIKKNGIW